MNLIQTIFSKIVYVTRPGSVYTGLTIGSRLNSPARTAKFNFHDIRKEQLLNNILFKEHVEHSSKIQLSFN